MFLPSVLFYFRTVFHVPSYHRKSDSAMSTLDVHVFGERVVHPSFSLCFARKEVVHLPFIFLEREFLFTC